MRGVRHVTGNLIRHTFLVDNSFTNHIYFEGEGRHRGSAPAFQTRRATHNEVTQVLERAASRGCKEVTQRAWPIVCGGRNESAQIGAPPSGRSRCNAESRHARRTSSRERLRSPCTSSIKPCVHHENTITYQISCRNIVFAKSYVALRASRRATAWVRPGQGLKAACAADQPPGMS